jgi:hypothetical protein
MESKLILKNLHAVLVYARERFNNEFVNQEVILSERFMDAFREYMESREREIEFFRYTTVLTNREGQRIYIANQWFAIASYFVDFCTELLTYQQYFEKVCDYLMICGSDIRRNYATRLKNLPSHDDKVAFTSAALKILRKDFPTSNDYERVVGYLWKFVSDYGWWAGSKTVNRHDFHISPLLNQLNVVNANAEFLAEIVLSYSSDLKLRKMVEQLEYFTINFRKNDYLPSKEEQESYEEAEDTSIPVQKRGFNGISISAASLERFQANNR